MQLSQDTLNELILIRRKIHENPELGYKEFKTAALLAAELTKLGISFESAVANTHTGIIATLTKGEGPTIMLRADMDALPLDEQTGLSFASKVENAMHACGHDVHTTMLLGAAMLLKDATFSGTVKFVFQPAEESAGDDPENKSGGQRIAGSGLLDGVSAAVGLHVHPLLPAGKISYCLGNALACVGNFKVKIIGKAGHAGAAPHLSIDPIIVANFAVMAIQTIVSRSIDPVQPAVFSVTGINSGVAINIVPEVATFEGTIRALDIEVYKTINARLKQILDGVCLAFGASYELEYTMDYPSTFNDAALHKRLQQPLEKVFGADHVLPVPPIMGSEDFAFYSRLMPSMFYFIGAQHTAGDTYFVHHPKMVVNEDCIPLGARFLAEAAVELLKAK